MNKKMIGFGILFGLFGASIAAQAQQSNMSFFVTSTNSGKGADFGGLAGADSIARRWRPRPVRGQDVARISDIRFGLVAAR